MWKTRQPDLIIGPRDAPQTLRWHLFRWRGIQVALHKWMRSDSDRALHDHSADNISILLNDCYQEVVGESERRVHMRFPLVPYFRRAETPHRVVLLSDKPVWTIWIRFKPRREWGFWCPKGWRHWKDFIDGDYSTPGSSSHVGKGCG